MLFDIDCGFFAYVSHEIPLGHLVRRFPHGIYRGIFNRKYLPARSIIPFSICADPLLKTGFFYVEIILHINPFSQYDRRNGGILC